MSRPLFRFGPWAELSGDFTLTAQNGKATRVSDAWERLRGAVQPNASILEVDDRWDAGTLRCPKGLRFKSAFGVEEVARELRPDSLGPQRCSRFVIIGTGITTIASDSIIPISA